MHQPGHRTVRILGKSRAWMLSNNQHPPAETNNLQKRYRGLFLFPRKSKCVFPIGRNFSTCFSKQWFQHPELFSPFSTIFSSALIHIKPAGKEPGLWVGRFSLAGLWACPTTTHYRQRLGMMRLSFWKEKVVNLGRTNCSPPPCSFWPSDILKKGAEWKICCWLTPLKFKLTNSGWLKLPPQSCSY